MPAGKPVNEGTTTAGATKTDAIVAFIKDKITSGEWKPGHKLPSQNAWAAGTPGLKVLYGTMRSGYIILRTQGWIRGEQGNGVFVTENPPIPARAKPTKVVAAPATKVATKTRKRT